MPTARDLLAMAVEVLDVSSPASPAETVTYTPAGGVAVERSAIQEPETAQDLEGNVRELRTAGCMWHLLKPAARPNDGDTIRQADGTTWHVERVARYLAGVVASVQCAIAYPKRTGQVRRSPHDYMRQA